MEQVKNQIKSQVRIQYNECFEFARAIDFICNDKSGIYHLPAELDVRDEDEKLKDKLKSKVTKELKKDLVWFYKNVGIAGIIEAYAVDYHTTTVEELLFAIEGSDDVVFCNYLGGTYISKYQARYYRDWSEVKHSVELMKGYIRECQVIDDSTRNNVVKCFEASRDTRRKIIDTLKKFYQDAYSKIKVALVKSLADAQKKYMEQLFLTPVDFVNKYLRNEFKIVNDQWPYRITIHLSLFDPLNVKRLSIHDYISQEGYLVLGKEAIRWYDDSNQSKILGQFLKIISDETRLSILKQLSIRPSYGQELAGKLKLTPATIKHHLSVLEELQLVTANKSEHKVYYNLNRQRLAQSFDDIKNYLF